MPILTSLTVILGMIIVISIPNRQKLLLPKITPISMHEGFEKMGLCCCLAQLQDFQWMGPHRIRSPYSRHPNVPKVIPTATPCPTLMFLGVSVLIGMRLSWR